MATEWQEEKNGGQVKAAEPCCRKLSRKTQPAAICSAPCLAIPLQQDDFHAEEQLVLRQQHSQALERDQEQQRWPRHRPSLVVPPLVPLMLVRPWPLEPASSGPQELWVARPRP
jgi:hypothetical protein